MAAIAPSDFACANCTTVEATSSAVKSSGDEDREPADGGVHDSLTTWVTSAGDGSSAATPTGISGIGRRAWSEMRSSSAMITQFASRDEPPSDMKGVVRPVSGMTRVTPPMTMKSWKATEKDRPIASSLPKPSRTPSAVRMPRSQKMR